METRKIIAFGKSSKVVSLPASWLEKNNVKKGDTIYLEERADELVLKSQSVEAQKEPKELKIEIDGKSTGAIKREIISAYINDVNIIYIVGKSVKDKAKEIRGIIHNLVALEIMEETSEKVMAKDFLNMNDLSITNLIRKTDLILRAMIIDSKKIVGGGEFESLEGRDDDVDRLTFLVFRAIKASFNSGSIMKKMQMTNNDLLTAWAVVFNIEKIADEVKRITNIIYELKPKKKETEIILLMYTKIEEIYLETMKSYYNKDHHLAYALAEKRKKIMSEIEKSFEKYSDTTLVALRERMLNMFSLVHTITRVNYEFV